MIRLIASDMDGTLLDESSTVPEETFELIHELHERGIVFAASSGRRYNTLRWFFEPVMDEMDYVASLGTEVYAQGRMIGREVFSYGAIVSLFELCATFDCLHLAIYDEDHCYLMDDLTNYVKTADKDLPNAVVRADPPGPDKSVIKMGICCDKPGETMDMTYMLERELGDRLTFMPSGDKWIDITPAGVDKATGIRQLMRYYGIEADEVMAFGDSMNDYAILRFAGHPRVMANARYTLRKRWPVVGSNVDHAVQRAMRDVLDGIE